MDEQLYILEAISPNRTRRLIGAIGRTNHLIAEVPSDRRCGWQAVYGGLVIPILDALGFTSDRRVRLDEYGHTYALLTEERPSVYLVPVNLEPGFRKASSVEATSSRDRDARRARVDSYNTRLVYTDGFTWVVNQLLGDSDHATAFDLDHPGGFWDLFYLGLSLDSDGKLTDL